MYNINQQLMEDIHEKTCNTQKFLLSVTGIDHVHMKTVSGSQCVGGYSVGWDLDFCDIQNVTMPPVLCLKKYWCLVVGVGVSERTFWAN